MTHWMRAVGALAAAALLIAGCSKSSPGGSPSTASASESAQPATATPVPSATPNAVNGVLPSSSVTPIPLPNVVQLSAPSRDIFWVLVAGQRLFDSTDHGSTWKPRGLPPSVQNPEIFFIDDHEGWLSTVGSPATQCQQQAFTLWHTSDSGGTWVQLQASGINASQCKSGLVFVDRLHGFVIGSDPNHPPVVYRTADGGSNWTPSTPISDPPGYVSQAGGVSLQAGTVRSFGPTSLVPVRAAGLLQYVYRSTDGGATWSYVATIPHVDGGLGIAGQSRWLVLVAPTQSIETTDSGASWHPLETDYSQASPVAPDVVFGDSDVGYATTRGAIQRTVDGGAHWTRIVTPGTG